MHTRAAALLILAATIAACGGDDVTTDRTKRASLVLCPTPTPCTTAGSCRGRLTVDGRKVPYYRNYALGTRNTNITRAVIMVHGINRNADDYFATTVASARQAEASGTMSCALRRSILIAPQFQNTSDSAASDEAVWSGSGWVAGDKSTSATGSLSSYRVLDQIIARLSNKTRFPNLETIVLAGHSAGGQLAQRYAAGGKQLAALASHVSFHAVVANPSSYLYLYDNRLVPGTTTSWRRPVTSNTSYSPHWQFLGTYSSCVLAGDSNGFSRYRRYRYGTSNLNSYMSDTGIGSMRALYPLRHVTYFVGTRDNVNNGNMDDSCAAMLQGAHRYARGVNYYRFVRAHFPVHAHALAYGWGIGHSNFDMFTSSAGVQLLFSAN